MAFVTFEDVIEAYMAKMYLDTMKLIRDSATLSVKFVLKEPVPQTHKPLHFVPSPPKEEVKQP